MNKHLAQLLLPFLALSHAGCATSSFAPARVGQRYPSRVAPEKIELYRSQLPTRPYSEIGTASVCCLADVDQSIRFLREKASKEGGDALVSLDVIANGATIATVVRYND